MNLICNLFDEEKICDQANNKVNQANNNNLLTQINHNSPNYNNNPNGICQNNQLANQQLKEELQISENPNSFINNHIPNNSINNVHINNENDAKRNDNDGNKNRNDIDINATRNDNNSDEKRNDININANKTDNDKDENNKELIDEPHEACKKVSIKQEKNQNDDKNNQKDDLNKKDTNLDEQYMIDLKDYKDLKIMLGSGGFGSVFLVENIHTHDKYAAKISKDNHKFNNLYHEIHFYSKYQHPLILSLHGYSLYDFHHEKCPILLLENMENKSLDTLFKNMNKSTKLKQIFKSKKYIILLGIASGIHFLHKKQVVHRDLKPGNILLDENFYPRINDFGSAIIYTEKNKLFKKQEKEKAGTLLYWAPEVLLDEEPYSFKVDTYAFSMIAYELLTGIEPFSEKKYTKRIQIASDIKNGIRPDLSMIHDLEIQVFFQKCWSCEPSERPDFPEIMQTIKSPKFQKAFQIDEKEYYQFLKWYNEKLAYEDYINDDNDDIIHQTNEEISNEIMNIRLNSKIDTPKIDKEIELKINQIINQLQLYYRLFSYKEYINMQHEMRLKIIALIECADKYKDDYSYEVFKYMVNSNMDFVETMHRLGLILKNGYGIQPDIVGAYFNFRLALEYNCSDSMIEIAKMYEKGEGIKKNSEMAALLYRKTANRGYIESMYKYGIMRKNGIGVEMNKKEAALYLELSADLGNSDSMFEIAQMLEIGDGIEPNYEKAAFYYKKASYSQNTDAMTNLGLLLISGKIPIDIQQSTQYFKMAIQLGSDKAMLNYAKLLCKIAIIDGYDENQTVDYFKKASKYFQNAAKIGNEEAKSKFKIFISDESFQSEDKSEVCKYLNAALKDSINDFATNLNKTSIQKADSDNNDAKGNEKTIHDIKVNIHKSYKNEHELDKYNFQLNPYQRSNYLLDKDIARCTDDKEIAIRALMKYNKAGISNEKVKQLSNRSFFVTYYYLSNFTIPEHIRKEIDSKIKSLNILKKCQYKTCHEKDPNDLFDFYYYKVKWQFKIRKITSNIFKKYGIESYMPIYTEITPFEHFLYFNESMIPDQIKSLFMLYLNTLDDVIEIKRNIFDGRQIATYLIIKPNTETKIIEKIRNLLYSKGVLFNTYKYPLQNNIVINEKMIFQNQDDFEIIVKEIESIGIKPINVERNKLYSYDDYSLKKLFQIFSFICFKDSKDKMKALNHVNSIIYKGHTNILHYNEDLYYASFDDSFHSPSIRNFLPKLFHSFKGVEDFQRYVLSIENPVERIYIGFDSNKHLKKCSYKYIYRVNMLDAFPNIKLFWKKKGLFYLYVKYPYGIFQSRFGELITKNISCFADDVQYNCADLIYFKEINKSRLFLTTYLGYKTNELFEKAMSMIENNSNFQQLDIRIGRYKEGYAIVNLVDESKQAFLYYESL